ncbi:MAG: hypothetical protein Q8Q95_04430 [bacterium]|nr:hypothetical protein [bacterium]
MPSGPEAIKNYGQPEKEDLSAIFGEDEKPKTGAPEVLSDADLEGMLENYDLAVEEKVKDINAEQVAKVWEKLATYEKKTVLSGSDESFEKYIGMYEELLRNRGLGKDEIDKKVTVMRAIRKLIKADDPRADLIDRNV